jgi:hypothetical protein
MPDARTGHAVPPTAAITRQGALAVTETGTRLTIQGASRPHPGRPARRRTRPGLIAGNRRTGHWRRRHRFTPASGGSS